MNKAPGNYGFQATQLAFAAHLRNPETNPPPSDIEDRRLAIYRDLIFNNIESFLSSGFPILHSIIAGGDWQLLVRDFIASHQSHSPYFLEISQEFLRYLNEQEPALLAPLPFARELAHYEWVELALDVSAEEFPVAGVKPDGDLLADSLVVSPLAWRLCYQFPVHKIGAEYQPVTPPEQPTCLVVYRNRQEQIQFLETNSVTLRLLQLLEDGELNGREALRQIADELGHPNSDFVEAAGAETLGQLLELSILCGFRH